VRSRFRSGHGCVMKVRIRGFVRSRVGAANYDAIATALRFAQIRVVSVIAVAVVTGRGAVHSARAAR
jgi:hypothetical protein